jgi:hypothetical protein
MAWATASLGAYRGSCARRYNFNDCSIRILCLRACVYNWDYQTVLVENIDKNKRDTPDDEQTDFEAPLVSTNLREDEQRDDPVQRVKILFENLPEAKA